MAKKQSQNNKPTFEESLQELERIVSELESGELGLDQALQAYELGIKHLKLCHHLLEKAERRIEILSGVDTEGNPVTEVFDEHSADDFAGQAAARSRKRSASTQRKASQTTASDEEFVDDPESLF